jgi:glycosyltransferase involved in cell wall biosynthesis
MRILIISPVIGKTAPGIVFERLIYGLSFYHEIDILTTVSDVSVDLPRVLNKVFCKKLNIHPRISKLLISLFGIDFFDYFWALKSIREVKKLKNTEYDMVFSFLSFQHYIGLITGVVWSRKYNCKLAVYSVDAIPAPIGWLKYDSYYKGLLNMMSKYLANSDAFFSSNQKMLDFQLKFFKPKNTMFSGVIYTPGIHKNMNYPLAYSNCNNFVFTGGIYGLRKADYLLEGFEKLLYDYPNSNLIFVGTKLDDNLLFKFKKDTLDKIKIFPFSSDLAKYYIIATALIDIDADLDEDVFLSSKITNYLMVNRLIISETGKASPSRLLFSNINSVIQCDHSSHQLFEAMKKTIEIKELVNFNDRDDIRKIFSLDFVVMKLNSDLNILF